MNNKGQTLVIFVILLPVICILCGYALDKCFLMYQEKQLKELATTVCEYALKEEDLNKIKQLALENDKKIEIVKVTRTDDEIQVVLEKDQKSVFSKLLGKEHYLIKGKTSCIEIEE